MRPYVLDTDTLTLYQENHSAVVGRVVQHSPADIAITVLSIEEQLSGWYTRLRRAKDVDDLAAVYERLAATAPPRSHAAANRNRSRPRWSEDEQKLRQQHRHLRR